MGATAKQLVDAATAEWERWGKASWNRITRKKSNGFHIDDEDKFSQYVIDNYIKVTRGIGKTEKVKWPSADEIGNDDYAWSAVFMSFVMRTGGFAPGEFPVSESHSRYIRWAIAAQKAKTPAAYWGYRIDDPKALPEVGDLIGYARAENLTAAKALAYFDKKVSYNSHTDLVVAKRAGEIDVMGGNVLDTVTRKTLALKPSGQLGDPNNFWFVVMKKQQP